MRQIAIFALIPLAACGPTARPVPPDVPRLESHGILLGNPARTAGETETPPRDPEVLWKGNVGRGILTPVIVSGPLLLSGTANYVVTAMRTATGRRFWNRNLDGPASGGVAWSGTRLYAGTEKSRGKAYALELRNGKVAWKRPIGASPHAPLVLGDTLVYATDEGQIIALAARDGRERWTTRVHGGVRAAPLPFRESLIVVTATDSLFMIGRERGGVQRRVALPGSMIAAPALRGDTLFIAFHSGRLSAFGLPEARELWSIETGAPIVAAPIAAGDGFVYVLDSAADVWRVSPSGAATRIASPGGAARGSLALSGDHLLVGRLDGTLLMLKRDGTEVWRRKLGGSIAAPATTRDGAIYVPLVEGDVIKLGDR